MKRQRHFEENASLCLSSIGINGEGIDTLDKRPKPKIMIGRGTWFVTAPEHLTKAVGRYRVRHCFSCHLFAKPYVLAQSLADMTIVLEGPNDKAAVLEMKKAVQGIQDIEVLLIDGSIDRQFLIHPDISDAIYFSLLISSHPAKQQRTLDLLRTFSLSLCSEEVGAFIRDHQNAKLKSLLFSGDEVYYLGEQIPFLDDGLKMACLEHREEACTLYIGGALSAGLSDLLASMARFQIVLDNYSCFQNLGHKPDRYRRFLPGLALYRKIPIRKILSSRKRSPCRCNFLQG